LHHYHSRPESEKAKKKERRSKHQHLTEYQKVKILGAIQQGRPIKLLSEENGVHSSTLKRLKNKNKSHFDKVVKNSRQKLQDPRTKEVKSNSKKQVTSAQVLWGPSEVSEEDYGIIPPTSSDIDKKHTEGQDTLANKLWGPSEASEEDYGIIPSTSIDKKHQTQILD